jgi:fluoroquinolone transport system permease protein
MKALLQQMKWQFRLLARNNIISLSIAVTIIYALIFFALKGLEHMDKVLTLLILNDPAITGMFFMGLSVIMEKNQQVLSALFVTPINHHIYLISRILTLSIIGWACALGMALAAIGPTFYFLHFSAGTFGICVLSCLVGVYLVCYTSEFMHFTLRSIPVLMILINLPLLNYFGVTDIRFFDLMPSYGSLSLIDLSYSEEPDRSTLLYGYASSAFWISLFYRMVYQTFMARIVNA